MSKYYIIKLLFRKIIAKAIEKEETNMRISKKIKIKDIEVQAEIKSYANSKTVRIYFKGDTLKITKPNEISMEKLKKIIKEDEEKIYEKYKKIREENANTIKQWETGETIYYKGKKFLIKREYEKNTDKLQINIDSENNKLKITVPLEITQEDLKYNVDLAIKKIFKNNTEVLINERLPYWSKITKIKYNEYKVRDATSRYGSCVPSKGNVYFSSRLVMLPLNVVDAVIVHELCHMKYKNHSKDFYSLVESFIPEYMQIDKWLKENSNIIIF